jgi:hypothetical protein
MGHEQLAGELQLQRLQQQKQRRQQQRQEEQHPFAALGRELPEKQHQSKHNPISEATPFVQRTCDQ